MRYDEEDEEEDGEEWGHNEDVARMERYSEDARDQALLVKARVDDEVEVVLVFRGFSSSLSGGTAADPARSVLPERAIIQSVDVVKGPFDPQQHRVPGEGSGMGGLQEPPAIVTALAHCAVVLLRQFHLLPTDQAMQWSSKTRNGQLVILSHNFIL